MLAINFGLNKITGLLLVLTLVIFTSPIYSDQSVNSDNGTNPLDSALALSSISLPAQGEGQKKEGELPTFTEIWCLDITDEPTREACWESYRSSFNYYKTGHEHRAKVFAWQFFSARIIFFVVLTLVVVGIYFAWVQFKLDMGSKQNGVKKGEEKDHTLELSTSGVKVSSPVLGVIILVLSLAFFYLYLVFVYPIAEIF
jgi:hypothetical protein